MADVSEALNARWYARLAVSYTSMAYSEAALVKMLSGSSAQMMSSSAACCCPSRAWRCRSTARDGVERRGAVSVLVRHECLAAQRVRSSVPPLLHQKREGHRYAPPFMWGETSPCDEAGCSTARYTVGRGGCMAKGVEGLSRVHVRPNHQACRRTLRLQRPHVSTRCVGGSRLR